VKRDKVLEKGELSFTPGQQEESTVLFGTRERIGEGYTSLLNSSLTQS